MILYPVQNKDEKITQEFGETQFSKGGAYGYSNGKPRPHNGIDFGIKVGTEVFAPFDGIVKTKDDKKSGYGLHIKLRSGEKLLECVFGHLSKLLVKDGQEVKMGDKIGLSGNSGNSTGAHLHFGVRRIFKGDSDLFSFGVKNYDDSLFGYFDPKPVMIHWFL